MSGGPSIRPTRTRICPITLASRCTSLRSWPRPGEMGKRIKVSYFSTNLELTGQAGYTVAHECIRKRTHRRYRSGHCSQEQNFDTEVQHLKIQGSEGRGPARLLTGTLLEQLQRHPQRDHFPGPKPTMRCCVYKERAILAERVKHGHGRRIPITPMSSRSSTSPATSARPAAYAVTECLPGLSLPTGAQDACPERSDFL